MNRKTVEHTPEKGLLVWCGKEGWLSPQEMVDRTNRGIEAYAKMQPLRFRSAMVGKGYLGARKIKRAPVHTAIQTPTPHEDNQTTTSIA